MKAVKFILVLVAFLLFWGILFFAESKMAPASYFLLSAILLIFLVFLLLTFEIKNLGKLNVGIMRVLEKTDENRINSEKLKNEVLAIIDVMPEGIIIIDKDDKVLFLNSKAEKFLKTNRKKILDKPILELKDSSGARKIIFLLLSNFKSVSKRELDISKNFILDIEIRPLILDKSSRAKVIIMQDVTKIKRTENAKNQFISVAAHQLKTPLSSQRLSIKMLLEGNFGRLNKEQRDILEKTYKNNDSLIYLVQDLLDDARIEDGNFSKNKSLVDLENLSFSVIDLYSDKIKEKKINFIFNKSDKKLPEVLVEKEKIKMVVQNLLDNAIKYTPSEGEIEISIKAQKSELEFKIKDSGIGIPEEQQKKLFTKFSRGLNTNKIKAAGSGLGLIIAKDIVEKHHGKIWFQSKENQGSIFFFSLPFVRK